MSISGVDGLLRLGLPCPALPHPGVAIPVRPDTSSVAWRGVARRGAVRLTASCLTMALSQLRCRGMAVHGCMAVDARGWRFTSQFSFLAGSMYRRTNLLLLQLQAPGADSLEGKSRKKCLIRGQIPIWINWRSYSGCRVPRSLRNKKKIIITQTVGDSSPNKKTLMIMIFRGRRKCFSDLAAIIV